MKRAGISAVCGAVYEMATEPKKWWVCPPLSHPVLPKPAEFCSDFWIHYFLLVFLIKGEGYQLCFDFFSSNRPVVGLAPIFVLKFELCGGWLCVAV